MNWRNCSVCKKEIKLGAVYQKCSISSCRKSVFCSVDCWDMHNSILGHKSAWAEEAVAKEAKRIMVSSSTSQTKREIPRDILIVASKLKNYVKDKHDLNTSGNVMERLSDIVRYFCDQAVDRARSEGRKTLMDRDFIDG